MINVSAKCMHRTMDPKPSSDPDLASMARSTGRASGLSARGLEGGRERGSLAQLIDMDNNRETSVLQLSNEFLSIRDKTSLRVGLEDEDETKDSCTCSSILLIVRCKLERFLCSKIRIRRAGASSKTSKLRVRTLSRKFEALERKVKRPPGPGLSSIWASVSEVNRCKSSGLG